TVPSRTIVHLSTLLSYHDFLFFQITSCTHLHTLSLHDALPIYMQAAAETIGHEYGAGAALVKGGHLSADENATDFLYDGKTMQVYSEKRIDTHNTHGTRCTYSAAVTGYLAKGLPLQEAVRKGKHFITAAIRESIDIGAGSGPTKHWAIRGEKR